jgi:regulator of RNase E activity RraA
LACDNDEPFTCINELSVRGTILALTDKLSINQFNEHESTMNKEIKQLDYSTLLELKRWNTPTIYNGWEQITARDAGRVGFNPEEVRDFMPQMGPMVGYAVTLVIEPSNPLHARKNPNAWSEYRKYIASVPGPKIVVVQDLDKPATHGAFWGEVNSNIHRALGCVGTIVDGAVRDIDEMCNAGFKALARRLCVGHAFSAPIRWNCEVEVFGRRIEPGMFIHADKHGFLALPHEETLELLDAARAMDTFECQTLIPVARSAAGKPTPQLLQEIDSAAIEFRRLAQEKFSSKRGEW